MRDETIEARNHDGNLNLEYFFQPSKYVCGSCNRTFSVQHPAMMVIEAGFVLIPSWIMVHAKTDADFWGAAFITGCLLLILVTSIVRLLLHPRVY
jgi:hypothetical protein